MLVKSVTKIDACRVHLNRRNCFTKDHNLIVYVEENDFENDIFRLDDQIRAAMSPHGTQVKPSLRKFCQPSPNYSCRDAENTDVNKIDLLVCMGGDGTLLHASGLFQVSGLSDPY